ncbi:hypothetical protein Pmar_PMAR003856, partial [Perkinsus marinus ATCC 50983]
VNDSRLPNFVSEPTGFGGGADVQQMEGGGGGRSSSMFPHTGEDSNRGSGRGGGGDGTNED